MTTLDTSLSNLTSLPMLRRSFLRCRQIFKKKTWKGLAAGREKEGELATTSLEFEFHLQFPAAPLRLSCQISANQREAETSTNVNKH